MISYHNKLLSPGERADNNCTRRLRRELIKRLLRSSCDHATAGKTDVHKERLRLITGGVYRRMKNKTEKRKARSDGGTGAGPERRARIQVVFGSS